MREPEVYFASVVRDVLDSPLSEHGFAFAEVRRGASVYWLREADRVFFSVGYLSESAPDYELLVGTGLCSEYDGTWVWAPGIGVHQLVPVPSALYVTFANDEELRARLEDTWSQVISPHALPLIDDTARLRRIVELDEERHEEELRLSAGRRRLEEARRSFAEGQYAKAIEAYGGVPRRLLWPADEKRIAYATKREGPSPS